MHGRHEASVIYRNLPEILERAEPATAEEAGPLNNDRLNLAIKIDRAMHEDVPADWKGIQAKEAEVKNVLFKLLNRDRNATQRLFELLKNQPGYH